MSPKVTIVDYGIGNLFSVARGFEVCGASVEVSNQRDRIVTADRLILPGVGAFGDGMAGLRSRGLLEAVLEYARSERPFLGICLGMQMMADMGEEFGVHQGLGLIPGVVRQISSDNGSGGKLKIPHVGWNRLVSNPKSRHFEETILKGTRPEDSVYFVHSFAMNPTDEAHQIATTPYGPHQITAVVGRGMIYGCQFHPEKSGPVGLRMIQNFLRL